MKVNKYIAFASNSWRRSVQSPMIQRNIDPDNQNINKVKLKIGHLSPAHKKDIMAKLISNDKIKNLMKASISNKDKMIMSSSPKRNNSNLLKQYNFSNENYSRNPVIFTNEELEKFNSIMKHPFELLDWGEEQIQCNSKMFLKSSIKPLINRMVKAPHSSHFSIRKQNL